VNRIDKIVGDLISSVESPVTSTSGDEVVLENQESAVEYLRSHDCDLPLGFEDKDKSTEDSVPDFQSHVRELEKEVEKITNSAEDWRAEARRRQRLSILIGFGSFTVGIITGVII
jgi:hypothetical protein